jgi:hypothetical protein
MRMSQKTTPRVLRNTRAVDYRTRSGANRTYNTKLFDTMIDLERIGRSMRQVKVEEEAEESVYVKIENGELVAVVPPPPIAVVEEMMEKEVEDGDKKEPVTNTTVPLLFSAPDVLARFNALEPPRTANEATARRAIAALIGLEQGAKPDELPDEQFGAMVRIRSAAEGLVKLGGGGDGRMDE